MPQLALYTFGVLKSPLSDAAPLTREFYDIGEAVYRKFSQHPGFVARAEAVNGGRGELFGADWGAWGEFAVPAWYDKGRTAETTALATTLSLWTGLRPAFDAVYTGLHRGALNRRYDWFERTGNPNYVFWWVSDGVIPTWQDGVSRLRHLQDHGAAPHAFTFHDPFTPDGTPVRGKEVGPRSDRVHRRESLVQGNDDRGESIVTPRPPTEMSACTEDNSGPRIPDGSTGDDGMDVGVTTGRGSGTGDSSGIGASSETGGSSGTGGSSSTGISTGERESIDIRRATVTGGS